MNSRHSARQSLTSPPLISPPHSHSKDQFRNSISVPGTPLSDRNTSIQPCSSAGGETGVGLTNTRKKSKDDDFDSDPTRSSKSPSPRLDERNKLNRMGSLLSSGLNTQSTLSSESSPPSSLPPALPQTSPPGGSPTTSVNTSVTPASSNTLKYHRDSLGSNKNRKNSVT